jgi:hypothetical protein
MVEWALDDSSVQRCLGRAAQAYLEDVFTMIANALAEETAARVS